MIDSLLDKLRERLCWRLCGDRIWNRDMSLENDALRIKNDHLLERVRELEEKYER